MGRDLGVANDRPGALGIAKSMTEPAKSRQETGLQLLFVLSGELREKSQGKQT